MKKTKLDSKLLWIINCMRKLTIKRKRDKNIWVYGAWLGDKYSDNSKYFFEYMNEKNKHIRSVWISKNTEVLEYIKSKGYEAYHCESLEGKNIMKCAGVALFTNSIMDLGNIDYCTDAYKIALWHGMPLKRIYLADNRHINCNKVKLKLKELKRDLYSDVERNLSICTSELTKLHVKKTFGVEEKDIIITGQPRNDILVTNEKLKISDVIKINIVEQIEKSNSKIFCYMPTYRSYKENEIKLNRIIKDMVYNKNLETILQKMNAYLVIKGHYLIEYDDMCNGRVIFVNDSQITCTQELLAISDLLITDYSSVFIDYLITEKPVIFLVPDYENYELYENGLNESYKNILTYEYATNVNELLNQIEDLNNNYNKYKEESKRLNNIFNTTKSQLYSQNVYNEIITKFK